MYKRDVVMFDLVSLTVGISVIRSGCLVMSLAQHAP